ncbi:MAG: AI-2E family transporter [Zetaproteobacteria bacterium]|nr:AI-2E family transporter [Zetaproteobacteria bacterium]
MTESTTTNKNNMLLSIACFIVLIAGLQAAQTIIVPMLMALLLMFIMLPGMQALMRYKVPTPLAITVVISFFLIITVGLFVFVGSSITQFLNKLPLLQQQIQQQLPIWLNHLSHYGIEISPKIILSYIDPSAAMRLVAAIFTGLGNTLANLFFILLLVILLLFESADLSSKRAYLGKHAPSNESVQSFVEKVNHYLLVKLAISAATGGLVALLLWFFGLDYPLLWGLLALLFNFIPNIGSIIAAIPAILLALLQLDAQSALFITLGYSLINIIMGNIIEPKFMAQGVGLSTLIVFISLIFWGFVFGPIGMLLSIPLTMIAKLALEVSEQSRWIAVLMSPPLQQP